MSVRLREYQDKEARLAALMDLPKAPYIKDAVQTFDPASAVAVEMNDGAVTLPGAEFPALGTVALATCIGVIAHNPTTKATGLVHIVSDGIKSHPTLASETSLRDVLHSVRGDLDEPIEVRLIGAYMGGRMQDGMINHIADLLDAFDAIVLSADLKGKPGPRNVAVDSSRWTEGLIRGNSDQADFMNDPSTGGFAEMIRQKQNSVDLENGMTWLPFQEYHLIYDATKNDLSSVEDTLDI